MAMKPRNYTDEFHMKFIDAYIEAKRLHKPTTHVAEKLKITQNEVRGEANYLRNRGIRLPDLKSTVTLDTKSVNAYIVSQLDK